MATPVLAMLLGAWALAATIGLGVLLARRSAAAQVLAACEARLRVVEAESREQAASQERERIYSDLHDDLGAKLLTIVHTSESERIATLAREAAAHLRLLQEANPIGFVIEQAGGGASSGRGRVLEIEPKDIHQRVPFLFGAREEIDRIERYHADPDLNTHDTAEEELDLPFFAARGLFRSTDNR